MLRLVQVPKEDVPARDDQWFSRWVNKKLGRPATPDVGILGTFLRRLAKESFAVLDTRKKEAAAAEEEELGGSSPSPSSLLLLDHDNSNIAISSPLFPALTSRDLNDALEYAGLQSWLVVPTTYPERLSPSRAAFGARGRGLCANYRNLYECDDEFEEVPAETVYYVS